MYPCSARVLANPYQELWSAGSMWDRTTPILPDPKSLPSSATPSAAGKCTTLEPVGAWVRGFEPHAPRSATRTTAPASVRGIAPGRGPDPRMWGRGDSATLLPALPAGLLEKLLVLLLSHLLAALLDQRRHAVLFLSSSFGSEQIPEIHAPGAKSLLEPNRAQSKRLRSHCHRRDQPEHARLPIVLEVPDAQVAARAVRESDEQPVELPEVEHRRQGRHEDGGFDPPAMELAVEVPPHRLLTIQRPLL